MNNLFQNSSKYYDLIYSDKDYEKECDFIEKIVKKYSKKKPNTILDCGCGTGNHAIILAKRGYEVSGIDISDKMIKIAKEKTKHNNINVNFKKMDLRKLKLNKKFDVCICMFAVIDYLYDTKDVIRVLSNIREHLKENALLVFDFWYGPAVLTTLPSNRIKIIENKGTKLIRFTESKLNVINHESEVKFNLIVTKENAVIYDETEKHKIRFFFPEELKHYLEESGFKLLGYRPFLDINGDITTKTWNVTAIARCLK